MKKMGIAFIAGAFVLVSVATGFAGPNVGGKNFNIQSRDITASRMEARSHMYALTGTPQNVSRWEWRPAARNWTYFKGTHGARAMMRVPASN